MLEFVDSDLYFVQDKNNFINPLLQVGSGSVEKSTGPGSGGPKIIGSDRIRILISAKGRSSNRGTSQPTNRNSDPRGKVCLAISYLS